MADGPRIVVLSSLFPSAVQPGAGLFVRERMFRVGRELPLAVVAPTPWFPLQSLLRRFKPGFRPGAPRHETQQGHEVWFPRFVSVPGALKGWDGLAMALAAWPRLARLKRAGRLDLIDAHFAYPDGYAATLLGRWLGVPVTITLRGTEQRQARDPALAPKLRAALQRATQVFAVSESLRQVALGLGIAADKVRVVGNGVDLARFNPLPRAEARAALGLAADAPVLVSVGGLCERKGFHRVIERLPALRERFPGLVYLVVGGPSPEGDLGPQLRAQVAAAGLGDAVRFLGPLPPDALRGPLSAADVFVLATRNEGWANVFLEAMACGLPVVTTAVGGNAEVVCRAELGRVVPFGDGQALESAIADALARDWDADTIRRYAAANTWDRRVAELVAVFRTLHRGTGERAAAAAP
ncbi:glycosyltransferase [Rubrivivax benzoatilyticus]|uniref:Glycosyltransferase family 4 protein n=1 Tax=Rubrivivax benzoatilyticus TaxID=316997 RepID=A0ABX0HXU2_9BURK|nr:glycosyltransferase [Rubrivivax benzoatilyticus]EGJ09808.1 glycosyl transferase group 1 [Rubrivivax benzoatilyticus JA2 = ATCC BAA-35]NHK99423.1 glycosyltransferase family 4 protein [Rubrivivax benzoatilyticus]NHL25297.1 glycosyltransferase family 4 protein [Rubrivivax benzoatilyticus]